jgi:hypothetical protein
MAILFAHASSTSILRGKVDKNDDMQGAHRHTSASIVTIFGRQYDPSTTLSIDLASSNLSGPIPSELALLTQLTSLNLFQNNLIGTIPSELGLLTELTYFGASWNALSGTLPSDLSRLTKLVHLDVSSNGLRGTLPGQLGLLSQLTLLDIWRNNLTGALPTGISLLTNLRYMDLHVTNLSGTIPSSLCPVTRVQAICRGCPKKTTIVIDCDKISCSCCKDASLDSCGPPQPATPAPTLAHLDPTSGCTPTSTFNTTLVLDFIGNLTLVTSQELVVLAQGFQDTYNALNSNPDTCDALFRRVTEVELLSENSLHLFDDDAARRKLQPGGIYGSQIPGFQATSRFFSFIGRIRSTCIGCLKGTALFGNDAIQRHLLAGACVCPVGAEPHVPTTAEFQIAYNETVQQLKASQQIRSIDAFSEAIELEEVKCSSNVSILSSEVSLTVSVESLDLTAQDIKALEQAFVESYNNLADNACDPKFRTVINATLLEVTEASQSSNRRLMNQRPTSKPTSSANLKFIPKYFCRDCDKGTNLFRNGNDAPRLLDPLGEKIMMSHRRLQQGNTCFCDTNFVTTEPPSKTEFALEFEITVEILDVSTTVVEVITVYETPQLTPPSVPIPSFFCFSGSSTVQTRQGAKSMSELKVQDLVLVASGKYEPVYSFAHHDMSMAAEYLQFLPSKLELSKNHMVLVADRGFVPASLVKVGDSLITRDQHKRQVVTAIRMVQEQGAYAPFTASGTLVVNDVVTSSYVSFQDSGTLLLGGFFDTGLSYQWLAQHLLMPYRVLCRISPSQCPSMELPWKMAQWFLHKNAFIMGLLLMPLFGMIVLGRLLENPLVVGLIVMLWYLRKNKKAKME